VNTLSQDFQRDGEQIPIVGLADEKDAVKCSRIRSALAQASCSAIMTYLIITCSIITVAVVQMMQGVSALQYPSTSTSFQKFPRVFPGLLICPLVAPYNEWSRDSSVSLSSDLFSDDIGVTDARSPYQQSIVVVNTNADSSRSKCSNAVTDCRQYLDSPERFQACNKIKETFGVPRPGWLFGILGKEVYIQNDAYQCRDSGPCRSVYPQQVGCIAFDHTMFPSSFPNLISSAGYGNGATYWKDIVPTNEDCNPMLEGNTSSSDSSVLVFLQPRFIVLSHSGLKDEKKFKDFFRKLDLTQQKTFPGLAALFYNPSEGVPKSLTFDENLFYSQNPVISGFPSAILTSWREKNEQASNPPYFRDPETGNFIYNFISSAPVTASVECSVSKVFASTHEKIFSGNHPSDLKANYSLSIATTPRPAVKPFHVLKGQCGCRDNWFPQMIIKFVRSETLFLSEVISTSLLTTLSLVASTSATIFAGRNFLQDCIELIYLKFKEFRN
jgi:hypothetical protein